MIKVTFPDGSVREYAKGTTGMQIAESISSRLAQEVRLMLKRQDIRAIVDDRNEKIGRKIRDNELKRIPYMLIVGEKEAENQQVAVRKQGEGDKGKGTMSVEEFAAQLTQEINQMINQY